MPNDTVSPKLEQWWIPSRAPVPADWDDFDPCATREEAERAANKAGVQFVCLNTLQINERDDVEATLLDFYEVDGGYVCTHYDGNGKDALAGLQMGASKGRLLQMPARRKGQRARQTGLAV